MSGTETSITERTLLHSIVEVARSVFSATAASIFLIDHSTGELVFEAVSGEGDSELRGTRLPAGTGIAGWVAASGEPMLTDDVASTSHFSLTAAESTGYVPRSIMAAPLIRNGDCIGVIEVLDRGSRARDELQDVHLLGLLAMQGAAGLELSMRLNWMTDSGSAVNVGPHLLLLNRIADRLSAAEEPANSMVLKLLAAANELMDGSRQGGIS
jgi:signal transduction protein with GAF and PtsI domain